MQEARPGLLKADVARVMSQARAPPPPPPPPAAAEQLNTTHAQLQDKRDGVSSSDVDGAVDGPARSSKAAAGGGAARGTLPSGEARTLPSARGDTARGDRDKAAVARDGSAADGKGVRMLPTGRGDGKQEGKQVPPHALAFRFNHLSVHLAGLLPRFTCRNSLPPPPAAQRASSACSSPARQRRTRRRRRRSKVCSAALRDEVSS